MKWYKYGALLPTAALLAACEGTSDGSAMPPFDPSIAAATANQDRAVRHRSETAVNTSQTGKTAFAIWLPRERSGDGSTRHERRPRSMTLTVSGAVQTFDLTPASGNCAGSDGRSECSITASFPVGEQTIAIALYERPNAKGKMLSTALAPANVSPYQLTHLSVALYGTPASVQLFLNKATSLHVEEGKPATVALSATAYTSHKGIIMPLRHYALPITLSDSDRSGATTLSNTAVVTAGTPIALHYNGAPLRGATIVPSVDGKPDYSGAVTLSVYAPPTPTPSPSTTPTITPTPKPTPTATAKPTPRPTPTPTPIPTSPSSPRASPSPPSSPQPNTILGCAYPTAWTTNIANVTPVSSSSANIQATVDAGGGGHFNFWVPTDELINMADDSTPLVAVKGSNSTHKPYSPVPWESSFFIEHSSDAHSMVLQSQSCHYYEGYDTSYSNGTLTEYNGGMWDLTKPYVRPSMGGISTASGIPIGLVAVRPEELSAGYIGHALGWNAVQRTVSQTACVSPAAVTNCTGDLSYSGPASEAANAMPFGAHIRCTVDDSAFPKEAKAVAEALKNFGAFLFDTGGYNSIVATNDSYGAPTWTYADTQAIDKITLSQCVVVPPPQ